MNASDQLARVTPYVERLLADDNAQDHLARAVFSLRRGSELAQHRGVAGAISDRQVRRHLGDAVQSLSQVRQSLTGPGAARRRGRRAVALAAAAEAVVLVARRRQS